MITSVDGYPGEGMQLDTPQVRCKCCSHEADFYEFALLRIGIQALSRVYCYECPACLEFFVVTENDCPHEAPPANTAPSAGAGPTSRHDYPPAACTAGNYPAGPSIQPVGKCVAEAGRASQAQL